MYNQMHIVDHLTDLFNFATRASQPSAYGRRLRITLEPELQGNGRINFGEHRWKEMFK